MSRRALILDANILIRAVLGNRVRALILKNAPAVKFFAPDVAYADAYQYLPALLTKRGLPADTVLETLEALETLVHSIDTNLYGGLKNRALQRIAARDADDWPVLACALMLDCPIWTEDADFFGTGIATWTSDRIALYFSEIEGVG